MLFEGSEKKVEVAVSAKAGNLRQLGEEFWHQIVRAAGAQVLSKLNRADCDAYLLSESSLFVWDNRFLMITCGRTTLVHALMTFLERVPADQLDTLVYERKSEYYPRMQETDFYSDVEMIKSRVPGYACRFGHSGEHHIFLFHIDREFKPSRSDTTTELLMHHIQGTAMEVFSKSGQSGKVIRDYLQLETLFPGYAWDDHVFEPFGYSINGIKAKRYITIHVTPEDDGSYVSFETNVDFGEHLPETLTQVVGLFRPQSYDVLTFRPDDKRVQLETADYWRVNLIEEKLGCGYRVCFTSNYLKTADPQRAITIEV